MEVLVGIIMGIAVYAYYYWEYLKIGKKLGKMEAKIDEVARTEINTIKDDLKWIKREVIALKVSMSTIKAKVGYMAGGFSFAGALVFAIVKEFVFK